MKLFFYTLLFWLLGLPAVFSQEYGYTHYDSKDGLAGVTVYCMAQDKDGFLWFGTEGGLSRFDGTHFKNFTREDGLPDNEIIQLFADSKGRIWMVPFKKSVCYYYKGKIYTPANDPILKRLQIQDNVVRFAEDKAGNILMHELRKLHLVKTNGQVTVIDAINSKPIVIINGISTGAEDGFMVIDDNRIYDYRNDHFQLKKTISRFSTHPMFFAFNAHGMVWRRDSLRAAFYSFTKDKTVCFPFKIIHNNFNLIDESHVGISTRDGAMVYDINKPDSGRYFLPGLSVSNMLRDGEGNIWFSTLGHGLYKLSSSFVLNIKIRRKNIVSQVFTLAPYRGSVLVGTELTDLYQLDRKTEKLKDEKIPLLHAGIDPVNALCVYKDEFILLGTSFYLYQLRQPFKEGKAIREVVIKGFFLNGDQLYVATKDNVVTLNPETFKITDTVWHSRSSAVFASHDTIYIGTLNGLYCRYPDRSIRFLGEKLPALKARVTTILQDSAGVLWIGTYGDGLIGYKNNRVTTILNRHNGLTSNVCRTLYRSGHYLWVGTDRGLNKVNLARPDLPVIQYSSSDGLASDIINTIFVDNNKVFAGTPEGITYFDEEKITSQSHCDLKFTETVIDRQSYYPDQAPTILPHKKNNIQFNFVGISYRSTGDIRYRYRLLGLDSNWHETRETFLSYPTLPSGEYLLQLQAINKFNVHSQLVATGFTIEKLLWEKTWFQVLLGLLFLAGTGLLVLIIVRRVRKREQEKTNFIKRINELEQLSRKAQMNPHFIFNSLNSIQHYVMDADVAGANKFISGFSRLIRQTLDFSSKPEISMEEELDYLTNYLELEKTRLEDAFTWAVSIEEGVDPADYYIPPMILQPFVENSVRHGLRFRRDKNGVVTITVKRENNGLVCILEDNGVGRKAAMKYKSISPINYQSKGLSLTADRITMYNKEHEQKITMQIDDLEDNDQQALGTRVTINFPVL
jgi:ligand-binding sensor domain-containing protein